MFFLTTGVQCNLQQQRTEMTATVLGLKESLPVQKSDLTLVEIHGLEQLKELNLLQLAGSG